MLKIIFVTILFHIYINTVAQQINWQTFEQVDSTLKLSNKPVFIDVYTNWCGWCKEMDRTTFANKDIINKLNSNFYTIKFNAESTKPILWQNTQYQYLPKYRIHEMAVKLLGRNMSFPALAILYKNQVQLFYGYHNAKELSKILNQLQ